MPVLPEAAIYFNFPKKQFLKFKKKVKNVIHLGHETVLVITVLVMKPYGVVN